MYNLELGDGFVRVTPHVPDCLRVALSYWHRERVGRKYTQERRAVYQTDHYILADQSVGEMLWCPPGYARRIWQAMTDAGLKFDVSDRRTKLPRIDAAAGAAGLRPYQLPPFAELVFSPGGIGKFPTGFGKTHMIAALIRAVNRDDLYARDTPLVAVAVDSQDVNKKNYKELAKVLAEREVGCLMSSMTKRSDDVVCVTLDSLHKLDAARIGVLIVDEVHSAGGNTRSAGLAGATKAVRWGLSATPTGRSDGTDIVTEGVVGPVVSTRTYQDGVACGALVPIEVYMVASAPPIHPKRLELASRDTRVSEGIENNPAFYDQVTELMRAIPRSMQTLVLAPHVHNLDQLKARCPDLPEVHGVTSEDELRAKNFMYVAPISKATREKRYEQMQRRELDRCAATYVYKQGVDFPELEVLVAIGGGSSEIVYQQIPGRASRKVAGKDIAYLIDFTRPWDRQPGSVPVNAIGEEPPMVDGPLRKDDKLRRRVYRKLGFTVHEVDSIYDIPFVGRN